jgi:hypothetical protein
VIHIGPVVRTGQGQRPIEPGDPVARHLGMRRILSTIVRLTGLALGVAAGGIFVALMWPDMMNDLYSAKALRHFIGMFTMGIVLAYLINWPFGWVADKLSPQGDSNSADVENST